MVVILPLPEMGMLDGNDGVLVMIGRQGRRRRRVGDLPVRWYYSFESNFDAQVE